MQNPLSGIFDIFGFTQIIDEPTRVTDTTATLLDLIFIKNIDVVHNSGTLNAEAVSDHQLV